MLSKNNMPIKKNKMIIIYLKSTIAYKICQKPVKKDKTKSQA